MYMKLLAISGPLLWSVIGSGVVIILMFGFWIYIKTRTIEVFGTVTKIEPPKPGDDYCNIELWSQNGNITYRVYVNGLATVKIGKSYIGLQKQRFEWIYSVNYIQTET